MAQMAHEKGVFGVYHLLYFFNKMRQMRHYKRGFGMSRSGDKYKIILIVLYLYPNTFLAYPGCDPHPVSW